MFPTSKHRIIFYLAKKHPNSCICAFFVVPLRGKRNRNEKMEDKHDEIVIYQSEDGLIKVDVLFKNETVWLTQQQMAVLFGKATSTINEHIKNIYGEGELQEETTTHKFGISEFMRKAPIYYNLDVIISVGYRVKSQIATA